MKLSDKANTAVGSTAAVVSATVASLGTGILGPIIGPVIVGTGAIIAVSSLVYKIVNESKASEGEGAESPKDDSADDQAS